MSADATDSEEADPDSGVPVYVRWMRGGYVLLAGVFIVGILIQIYIAGMAVFIDPANWTLHTTFVHAIEWLPLLMLVLAFAGRMPSGLKWLPVGLFGLIIAQYALIEAFGYGSLVAALHPVNGVVIFWGGVITTRRAWRAMVEPAGDEA